MTSSGETSGEARHGRRKRQEIRAGSSEVSFRVASREELLIINDDAEQNRFGARWSSADALRRQVSDNSIVILSPALQNDGEIDHPDSYRCFVWFYSIATGHPAVSLLDVATSTFSGLREASSAEQLKKVARTLLDGYPLTPLE